MCQGVGFWDGQGVTPPSDTCYTEQQVSRQWRDAGRWGASLFYYASLDLECPPEARGLMYDPACGSSGRSGPLEGGD